MNRILVSLLVSLVIAACVQPLRAQSPAVRQATLLWQVDGSESGDPFGRLGDYLLLKDGTLWALDFKDQIIRRYDARGKALPSVGRKGSGPGEMRNANGLALAPDGSIWVNDPANSRFAVFASDGKAVRSITVPFKGYMYRWGAWFDHSGELVEVDLGKESRYRRLDNNGKLLGTIPFPNCPGRSDGTSTPTTITAGTRGEAPSYFASYPFSRGMFPAADRRGHFWCASSRGTRVARIAYGKADTIARTSFDIPLIPVQKAERDEAIQSIEKNLTKYQINDFNALNVPSSKSGIFEVYVDDNGRLWVAHTAPWKEQRTTYDVFDGAGKALFRVTLPVRAVLTLPVVSRGDEFVVATMDEDDVVRLSRYRLR
ncbi:MAG: hypothetical protein IBJ03_02375 [Gemmatimonadaceae bacterium]|nr:hypothetical protein [Gemmatimonadaceae bacterium]